MKPIASEETVSAGDSSRWEDLAAATTIERFVGPWLDLQCRELPGAVAALLLLGPANRGPYRPASVWPVPEADVSGLAPAAERALRSRQAAVEAGGDGGDRQQVAMPVAVRDALHGALVVEIGTSLAAAGQEALRRLHWGAAWLALMLRQQEEGRREAGGERVFAALDLLATVLDEARFQAACTALVTELATRLDCDRVSLGFDHGGQQRVQAISHTASFGKELNLVRLLGAAMDEAIDQGRTLSFPAAEGAERLIVRAHAELARQHGAAEVCTIPVPVGDRLAAALTLERPENRPLDSRDIELCETVGALAAPVLVLKRDQERWLAEKAWVSLRGQLEKLFGPRHVVRKAVLALVAILAVFFSFATGRYRVTADSVLEGAVQRAVVAPYEGYIAEAAVRAGDEVAEGDALAVLDDRDLKLERLKVSTRRAQLERERRDKVAERDRAEVRVLSAQIEQAEAELALLDEQLARTRLHAPFRGIVVSGDLSQSLGAPVRRGDLLFQVAPLDAYRLILRVDEQDIGDVRASQTGTLVLGAMPEQPLPFRVTRLTPVTTAEEGRNYFRVEAQLAEAPARLRPGMEGVAKIDVGERKLLWIWTRRLVAWVRLQLWAWWP